MTSGELYLYVRADYNDADYVSSFTKLEGWELETFDKSKDLIEAIKNEDRYNWCTMYAPYLEGEDFRDKYVAKGFDLELIETFDEAFVPTCEEGIHTIVEILLLEVTKNTKLL